MSERVVVVGGGLAGLSAAARLASRGYAVTLLEKTPKPGGRAITIPLKGFNFNFGAHAIYGRDRSVLRRYERELGLRVDWRPFSPRKVLYDEGESTTVMPATLEGVLRTRVLDAQNKLRFVSEIAQTIGAVERGEPGVRIDEYLAPQPVPLRKLLLDLASSNFFTSEPERIPSPLYFQYYRRLFTSARPLSYIGGGWQSIVDGFAEILSRHGGQIVVKERAQRAVVEGDRVVAVEGKEGTYAADRFAFCVPPSELKLLFAETPHAGLFEEFARYLPTEVVVYDIGLERRIVRPYTYIYHRAGRGYITDISYYDRTCVPPGGQLRQAVTYLSPHDIAEGAADAKVAFIESLYDKHYPGWRELQVARRISKRATVQEIKCVDDQRLMPVKFYSLENAYFAGDWCEGEGQLSELSLSSAYEVTERILARRASLTAAAV
jgi:phytoene dehydrogenase-like protein